jgi:hypothetical protein
MEHSKRLGIPFYDDVGPDGVIKGIFCPLVPKVKVLR